MSSISLKNTCRKKINRDISLFLFLKTDLKNFRIASSSNYLSTSIFQLFFFSFGWEIHVQQRGQRIFVWIHLENLYRPTTTTTTAIFLHQVQWARQQSFRRRASILPLWVILVSVERTKRVSSVLSWSSYTVSVMLGKQTTASSIQSDRMMNVSSRASWSEAFSAARIAKAVPHVTFIFPTA